MSNNEYRNNKLLEIDKKLDLVLEQFDLVLKSNAQLRADMPEIISRIIKAVMNKRAVEGYSRIAA